MASNLAQYGSIAAAFGLHMSYNSSSAALEIQDVPKGYSALVNDMMEEISLFDNTATYIDGVASFCVAVYIDNVPNPIPERTRLNVLHALGIMKDDLFIHQILMLQKNNRSWHRSDKPNMCTHFGEICTHRGINPDPERKGRTSNRQPNQYHPIKGKDQIAREQLVTPNLEAMFRFIPEANLTSGRVALTIDKFDLKEFSKLETEEKVKFVSELQELI